MTTIVISISPGDIQVISNSQPADGYIAGRSISGLPGPELAIIERNKVEEEPPPLSQVNIDELHDKYKM